MRGAVVDADLEPAPERDVGDRGARFDAVRVEPGAHERAEQPAVAALDQRDPAGAAA